MRRVADSGKPGSVLRKLVVFARPGRCRLTLTLVSLLFPWLVAAACWLDGTLLMLKSDKGLLQYYGFWAIFCTAPFIVMLTSRLFDSFTSCVAAIDAYCMDRPVQTR